MPIVGAEPAEPLAQGDILTGLPLFITNETGAPFKPDIEYCVVLSRDCNALRQPTIIVGAIKPFRNSNFVDLLKNESVTLEHARRAFAEIRDGYTSPDTVYLGTMPGESKRLALQLSMLHTIIVPADVTGIERQTWVKKHRCAKLDFETIRHVQVRMFASITRQGFDDYGGWCDADLDDLVRIGAHELSVAQTSLTKMDRELAGLKNQESVPAKQLQGIEAAVGAEQRKVDEVGARLKPFQDEQQRRKEAKG